MQLSLAVVGNLDHDRALGVGVIGHILLTVIHLGNRIGIGARLGECELGEGDRAVGSVLGGNRLAALGSKREGELPLLELGTREFLGQDNLRRYRRGRVGVHEVERAALLRRPSDEQGRIRKVGADRRTDTGDMRVIGDARCAACDLDHLVAVDTGVRELNLRHRDATVCRVGARGDRRLGDAVAGVVEFVHLERELARDLGATDERLGHAELRGHRIIDRRGHIGVLEGEERGARRRLASGREGAILGAGHRDGDVLVLKVVLDARRSGRVLDYLVGEAVAAGLVQAGALGIEENLAEVHGTGGVVGGTGLRGHGAAVNGTDDEGELPAGQGAACISLDALDAHHGFVVRVLKHHSAVGVRHADREIALQVVGEHDADGKGRNVGRDAHRQRVSVLGGGELQRVSGMTLRVDAGRSEPLLDKPRQGGEAALVVLGGEVQRREDDACGLAGLAGPVGRGTDDKVLAACEGQREAELAGLNRAVGAAGLGAGLLEGLVDLGLQVGIGGAAVGAARGARIARLLADAGVEAGVRLLSGTVSLGVGGIAGLLPCLAGRIVVDRLVGVGNAGLDKREGRDHDTVIDEHRLAGSLLGLGRLDDLGGLVLVGLDVDDLNIVGFLGSLARVVGVHVAAVRRLAIIHRQAIGLGLGAAVGTGIGIGVSVVIGTAVNIAVGVVGVDGIGTIAIGSVGVAVRIAAGIRVVAAIRLDDVLVAVRVLVCVLAVSVLVRVGVRALVGVGVGIGLAVGILAGVGIGRVGIGGLLLLLDLLGDGVRIERAAV